MSRELKINAAEEAFKFVKDDMKLGIGTGSTAEEFIRILARHVGDGLNVVGVPTSERSHALCSELGVKLATLDELPELDLAIDGADEVDQDLNLIKGGGAALLREKIVANASKQMVVIVDDSKMVECLGQFPLPIEVNKFGINATLIAIEKLNQDLDITCPIKVRQLEGKQLVTDEGHLIVDASYGRIPDANILSKGLLEIPGVVQHGLFLNMASAVVIASPRGIELKEK